MLILLSFLCGCSDKADSTAPAADSVPAPGDSSGAPAGTWYADADGDGYGDPTRSQDAAEPPVGHVPDALDCDDADPGVHPDAAETCDGRDQDCDGVADDGVTETWYPDADGDGWGDDAGGVAACEAPAGYYDAFGDCDDADPAVNPDSADACGDGVDQDCSGQDFGCRPEGTEGPSDVAYATWLGRPDGAGDLAGAQVSCDADTDGDGTREVIIVATEQFHGDYTGEPELGRMWVTTPEPGVHELGDDPAETVGDARASLMEVNTLGSLHDLDGDGDDELIVGSFVFSGPVPLSASDAEARLIDATSLSAITWSSAALDGQRYAIGGWYHALGNYDSTVGAVFVLEGMPSGTVVAEDVAVATLAPAANLVDSYFGDALCAGDIDGDGILDMAVGAPSSLSSDNLFENRQGVVYLAYGPFEGDLRMTGTDGSLVAADAGIWPGNGTSRGFGRLISCGGDVTGDGLADLLVGAPDSTRVLDDGTLADFSGGAWLFPGPLSGTLEAGDAVGSVHGTETYEGVGMAVESDVDLDADGRADTVIGASLTVDTFGAAAVFYAPIAGDVTLYEGDALIRGANAGDATGSTLAGCPDMNGDGADELLLGAPGESTNAEWSGAAYLVLGGGH